MTYVLLVFEKDHEGLPSDHAFPWRTRLRENNRTQLRQLGVLPHSRILRCSLEQRVLIINGQMVCAFVLDRILPFNFKSSMKHAITCLWSDICFHTRQVPLSSMRGNCQKFRCNISIGCFAGSAWRCHDLSRLALAFPAVSGHHVIHTIHMKCVKCPVAWHRMEAEHADADAHINASILVPQCHRSERWESSARSHLCHLCGLLKRQEEWDDSKSGPLGFSSQEQTCQKRDSATRYSKVTQTSRFGLLLSLHDQSWREFPISRAFW